MRSFIKLWIQRMLMMLHEYGGTRRMNEREIKVPETLEQSHNSSPFIHSSPRWMMMSAVEFWYDISQHCVCVNVIEHQKIRECSPSADSSLSHQHANENSLHELTSAARKLSRRCNEALKVEYVQCSLSVSQKAWKSRKSLRAVMNISQYSSCSGSLSLFD